MSAPIFVLPEHSQRRALNDELPADIHLLRVTKVTREFHARHSAVGRSYLYQVARRRTGTVPAAHALVHDERADAHFYEGRSRRHWSGHGQARREATDQSPVRRRQGGGGQS